MKNRIADLYQKDAALRYKMMALPCLATFLTAFVMVQTGTPNIAIEYAVLSVCGTLYAVEVLRYRMGKVRSGSGTVAVRFPLKRTLLFAVVSLVFTGALISAPIVQARALNLRLEKIAHSEKSDPKSIEETSKVITLAKESKVKLSQDLVKEAQQNVFSVALKLNAGQFREGLPDFANALSEAKTYKVSLPIELVEELRAKLMTSDFNDPGFWQAASEMINYRSTIVPGGILPPQLAHAFGPPQNLDTDCLAEPRKTFGPGPEDSPAESRIIVWNDCTLHMDDVNGFLRSPTVANGSKVPIALFLYRVKLVYRGGDLIPATDMEILDCQFDFQVSRAPDARAREMYAFLLSKNYFKPLIEVPLVEAAFMDSDGNPHIGTQ